MRDTLGKSEWESAQRSILNAHYTDPPTVNAMWNLARKLGFSGGRVLEPSMGIGNFFGLMPRDIMGASQLTGIELDEMTAGMAQRLYPDAIVRQMGYQDSKTADHFYDLVIGNWPFARQGPIDRRYRALSPSLHDYFFLKAVDQVRPGGLVIGVTSAFTMDKKGEGIRRELAKKAELVAAFRLPTGAFEDYAGTKVVTDIIILKKRDTPLQSVNDESWVRLGTTTAPSGAELSVNQYYIEHPDQVLGVMDIGRGTTTGAPGLIVNRPDRYGEMLSQIADRVNAGIYEPRTTREVTRYLNEETKDRQQSATIGNDGQLYQVQGDRLARLEDVQPYAVKSDQQTADRAAQIRGLISLRRQTNALFAAERDATVGDARVEELRADLKKGYQDFVAKHGPINESFGLKYLNKLGDPYQADLAALETWNGKDWKPATALNRPTTRGKKMMERPSVADALVLARNERSDIDIARIAELANTTPDKAANTLLESGAIFQAPDGRYEVADQYLSGNVRRKLREAQAAKADGVEGMDRNIAALEQVIPKTVPYYNIEARMGAPWVPVEDYGDFVKELLGADTESDGLPISFIAGRWKIGKSAMFSMAQGTPWQTNDVSFRSLLSAALNVRTLTVKRFDPVDKTTYVDEAATKEANQKVADLREAFTTWLWKTPDRQVRLEKVYNEIMNAMAAPEFDGSFLNFEGMALQRGQQPFNLRQHQIDAIYRGIANRRGLYAHEVGTGKTYTIAGVAVESRRYGLSRKPLILAHNANSKAVADGIVEMYPNAKVLYINNLDSKSIETKLRQIKMDDWDAVVVPHSLIERFALTRETLMDLAQEQIDALEEEAYTAAEEDMGAQGERLVDLALDGDESAFKKLRSPSAKDLVRARNQIIAKIEDHAQRASREGAVPFEELGIDSIIVDEAHLFKKPPLETRMKMRGLNTATSNRGLAMSFLTNYIKKINGGKGVHLFTGTPITNTLSETFHMMRYVMDDEMRRDGLQNWDGWFNTFASETNDIEITAAGEYEPVTRLASFINVADLRRMMAPYTDIVFADDMPEFKPRKTRSGKTMADTLTDSERAELLQGRDEEAVGRPYKKVVVDSAEMTPEQAAIMALLTERARRFRAASRKERREIMLSGSPESPLLVETAAANAGLDQRLFKEKAYDGSPNSKAARAVRNLLTHYREHPKTTQVVFMERGFEKSGFNLAKSIVDDLVAGGIPRKEIAIVDGSTSADRRKAVADAMNRAEIRVVIGNTQTLGVGVNMQANLRAMHHLDAPWTPADLEQRNGRGHRQGNAWNTVMEYRYLTERIDGRRWQVLAVKDRFIKSFLKADENTRVIEGDAVDDSNQSDIVSTLSEAAGDPRILIINKLKADLEKLHARERMHGRAVVDAKREIDYKLQRESAIQARIDAYQRYQEVADKAKQSEEPAYLIDGTRYADRKDAQTALDEFISRKAEPTGTSPKKIGQVYGLDLSYMWSGTQSMGPIFYVGSKGSPLIDMGRATILSAENAVWSLPRRIKEEGDALSENQRSVENLRRVVREPFGRAEELKRKVDQLQRVEQDVQNNPVPPPGWLRNGAPVDSVAYHQGKPYVVTGHRWTAVNYSVELQSDDGKTQRAVPYDEVTDAQNIPLYEPHPFVAPDVAEKNRESRPTRGLSSATPITPAQTRADLSRALGADVVARLEQSGRLVIHDKPPTGAAAGAQGWVDKKGVIHLVPANLESSALSVLLHESAHLMRDDRFSPESRALGRAAHAVLRMSGLQGLIGNPSYNDLIQQVYRLAAEGNKTAQAALAKATAEPGNTAEEALSYIVEYADEKLPLYRRIMSAIRAALYRLGIKVKLTPADLRALALSALKSRANEVTARNAQPAFSLPESAEAEAEQDQLWREFQAVRAQFQERQASQSAFERWFGQGVEGVNVHKGKPLTLFHGTNNPEFNRWDESLAGQASRHPTAGLGFFMTADARSAARYGSRLLELNAKINKPYFMTDADLTSIEDTQDAARFRRKLQAQGYDAAVIVAPGAAPYVAAFQSSQVKLTSNTNPTESEDFRYSSPGRPPNLNSPRVAARAMDDIGGVMNALKPGEKPLAKANPRNFAQMLTDLKANTRPQWLGLLTRNMQLELAREVLPRPMVEQFENAAEAMDAAESKMIQREAFPLADRWQALIRKHREQADRLARSLYMATWTGTDPRQPMPTKKRAEWIRTKAAYDGLTDPEAKKLFSEVLGFYQGQTERLFKELQNRIDRHSLPAADKLAAKDMLRQEFERMKDDGPYVPLMRFGDLTVFAEARTAGEKPVFATFETVQDQRAFADWLKKEGYQPQLGVKTEEVAKRALPQGDFVGKLAGIIDKTTQGPEGQVLKDAMYQLFLRSLPEQAIRKHFIHRRFVPGYTADALRTFATFGRRSAKQIARLAHSDRMSDALEAMAKANRDGQTQEPVSAGHLINELEKSFQWAMNPGTNALSSRLTHLGFLWHLGASPAHLLLNLSQQAQVTFPWLAGEMHGKIGSGSVAAALAKANKDFIASNPFTSADKRGAAAKKRRSDLEGEFNGDMGRALKALEESGKTDKTQTYSLSGLSEEDSWLWSKPYLRKFTEGAAWFFHVAEVIDREASAIAAYRLARRAGMSHEQGYDLARRAINETHFDYSPANRARFMRGNVAKVLTLFKQYSLNISWQLGRNAYLWARGGSKAEKAQARTKLLGMLGMTMVMAGAAGMPFYGEIMWLLTQLLNATRDDDEPEWDADTEFRSLLDRAFGATGDEAVRHGLINAFMGIDVSSRIKLDDLWWRPIGDDADGKNMAYQMMEQALGPVAGLFVRGVATADGLMESLVAGDNARGASWRAIEGSLPKALKDISRSIRYAEEGATTFQGATLLPADRISALAKLGQAMGFVPAELAERYSENRAMKSLERRILTRRRALLDTVAMGLLSQDDEVVRAASEDIAAFNRRYPTVAITGDTISKSLRGRLRAKIETEAAGGARLDKRLAGMLLEGIR